MKIFSVFLAIAVGLGSYSVVAQGKDINTDVESDFYAELGADYADILAIKAHPKIAKVLGFHNGRNANFSHVFSSNDFWDSSASGAPERVLDPIGDYTPIFPHESTLEISKVERALLKIYLDNPRDALVAQVLAVYNLRNFYETKKYSGKNKRAGGQAIKYAVLSLYFLNRSDDLGVQRRWVARGIEKVELFLDKTLERGQPNANENLDVVKYFKDAFNYNEKNRYVLHEKLLNAMVDDPGNAFVNFYFMANNVWNAGEEAYDEPGLLNNMILASYFAVRSINLSEKIERSWETDPKKNVRFRLANITGGFSVFTRRWFAKLQGDVESIPLLDDEHRKWYAHHKNFHAFTLGATFFHEKENFAEGFAAWEDATLNCDFAERTCVDRPLFSYNRLGFVLSYVDFLLKAGNKDFASIILSIRHDPVFEYDGWTLGRAAWEHRENNMDAIISAYQNDSPKDEPSMFVMTKKKWGDDLITCQGCHQAQGRIWSEEEKANIWIHKDSILTIGVYPEITTNWYGSLKN